MSRQAKQNQDEHIEPKFLEDFAIGDEIRSGELAVTAESIRDFATRYDPQAIHLDPAAAPSSPFGELIGSGWQTLALTMRLVVDARPLGATPLIGVKVDRVRLREPLRPGDRLRVEARVVDLRRTPTSDQGFLMLDLTTRRADGTVLATQQWTLLVPPRERRPR